MLTKVDIVTQQGTTLSLPLRDTSAGFLVKDITGLDPVKSTIVTSKFSQIDGTRRQSSSRENRNIVFKLGFTPDYAENDISSLRNHLYQFLMPKSVVLMKYYRDDVLFAQIEGEVESCETPLFSKEPEVAVSLLCFNPDFRAPDSVRVGGNTVADATEQVVPYLGTTPSGFVFTLSLNRTESEFMIYNHAPNGDMYSLECVGPVMSGDVLEINTNSGGKGAWLTRSSVQTSVLYTISPASNWLNLYPGNNRIRVLASGAPIPFTIDYFPKYGGL